MGKSDARRRDSRGTSPPRGATGARQRSSAAEKPAPRPSGWRGTPRDGGAARSGRAKPARTPAAVLLAHEVAAAVATMAAPSGTLRFAAGKSLALTAAADPMRVYPFFDALAALLASPSKVVRWNALQVLARLAPVDADRKLDAILPEYLAFVTGDNLISAANAIGGAGQIAAARPELLERILPVLLAVEHMRYETDECRNVAVGHVLEVLDTLGHAVCRRSEVAGFIHRQRGNPRNAVALRAARMAGD